MLSARITHSHIDAVNGAILQAIAVEYALKSDLSLTWKEYWNLLKEVVDRLESQSPDDEKYLLRNKHFCWFYCV